MKIRFLPVMILFLGVLGSPLVGAVKSKLVLLDFPRKLTLDEAKAQPNKVVLAYIYFKGTEAIPADVKAAAKAGIGEYITNAKAVIEKQAKWFEKNPTAGKWTPAEYEDKKAKHAKRKARAEKRLKMLTDLKGKLEK